MVRDINITINWNYETDPEKVPNKALIYMILSASKTADNKIDTDTYKILDIGQTGDAETRLTNHDRKPCWEKQKPKSHILVYKFALMPSKDYDKTDRLIVECCLRSHTKPACGEECNKGYNRDDTVKITNTGKKKPLNTTYSCKKK